MSRRPPASRPLVALLPPASALVLLALAAHAQVPGEVLRAVRIPDSRPGDPALTAGDGFGRQLVSPGDLDGDGTVDLLVGAANDSDGVLANQTVANAGAAWLLFLTPEGTARESVKYSNRTGDLPLLEEEDFFGKGVGSIGDLNGDGVTDIAVGAPGDDDGALNQGAVYVLFLQVDGSIQAVQKISALEGGFVVLEAKSEFGRGIAPLGDLDGDGVLDLAVSRMTPRASSAMQGTVYVLFLRPDGTVRDFREVTLADVGLEYGSGFFGFHLASQDLDDDGLLDLLVGDIGYDGSYREGALHPQIGAIYFLPLNADGTPKPGAWHISQDLRGFTEVLDPGDHFGNAVDCPRVDFDGDGVNDLVVGRKRDDDRYAGSCAGGGGYCPDYFTCCFDSGAAYILFMNPDWTVRDWQKISNTEGNFPWSLDRDDRFGQCVDTLGDLDGDGFPEVAISARWEDTAAPNAGIVYICTISDGSITPTVAWFGATPLTGNAPLAVSFADASMGVDLDAWSWDFGDGTTSSLQNPSHVYTNPGTYSVRLDVDGLSGFDRATRANLIVVAEGALTADFDGSPRTGSAPLAVAFVDLSAGDPVSWAWDFGDGATSTLPNPAHTYLADGSYTVSLTVTNAAEDSASRVRPDFVVVETIAAQADFDAAPRSGTPPLGVVFTDLSIGDLVSWEWDFGDGGTSAVQNPTHVYEEAGTYTVSLTVTAAGLETDTLSRPGYIVASADFVRIGCDPTAAGTLTVQSGLPAIGTTIVFAIDNPYGTQAAGSATFLRAAFAPAAQYPCGFWKPNYGMAYAGAPGEILLATIPAPLTFPGTAFGGAGNPGLVAVPIPNNLALIGRRLYGQGVIFDSAAALGVQYGVTDGLEFVLR
ncbi:MAG: PKD domain-containing protein [Planctomycetota bacterium]